MPRIRSIKPEFWTSAQVLECSRNARLLFLGLWNFCDDAGRHPWSPKQCKASVFPSDDLLEKDILGMLEELSTNGLIKRYTSDGKDYFYVTGWSHQRIDKPQSPKYPDPFAEHSKSNRRPIPPDRIGKDRIGKEKKNGLSREPYFFESGVIRLNEKNFLQWSEAFSHLDLKAELIQLEAWAAKQPNWFTALSGALAKRNRKVKAEASRMSPSDPLNNGVV